MTHCLIVTTIRAIRESVKKLFTKFPEALKFAQMLALTGALTYNIITRFHWTCWRHNEPFIPEHGPAKALGRHGSQRMREERGRPKIGVGIGFSAYRRRFLPPASQYCEDVRRHTAGRCRPFRLAAAPAIRNRGRSCS